MLDENSLLQSSVVANCRMNRERQLEGSNGYSTELQLHLSNWLTQFKGSPPIRWLDVCCGTGRALIEAVEKYPPGTLKVVGVDLAGHFLPNPNPNALTLLKSSFEDWDTHTEFDLITCVHGLHYIGDKLATISKMLNSLGENGLLVANIDIANFKFVSGRPAGKMILNHLQKAGIEYSQQHRLIRCSGGPKTIPAKFTYLGADDLAGPNYTGQPAVNSIYDG